MAVRRAGPHDAELVAGFAGAFVRLARSRLPASGNQPTRAQAREALVSYVTARSLGDGAGAAAASLASSAAEGASVLDVPSVVPILGRLAAGETPESGISFDSAAGKVSLALQKPLANASVVSELNLADLRAAALGVARSPEVLPEAAEAIVAAIGERVTAAASAGGAEMPPRDLLDLAWTIVELRNRVQERRAACEAVLSQMWPCVAGAVERSFASAASSSAVCLPGLARIAAALAPDDPAVRDFATVVLQPNAKPLLAFVRENFEAFEPLSQLLRLAGKDVESSALQQVALEALPALPGGLAGAERLLVVAEWEAAVLARRSDGSEAPAFAPFFDFALEELLQRISDLSSKQLRRAAKLFAEVPLERPDLLSGAAATLAQAAVARHSAGVKGSDHLSDIALNLSAFAALFIRLANQTSASKEDLNAIAAVFDADGEAVEAAVREASFTSRREIDAACLALSGFAQVACKAPETLDSSTQQRLLTSGVRLMDALCTAWTRSRIELAVPQAHILVTALRGFCARPGAPAPPLTAVELLRALVERAEAAPVADRDAQLRLAMLRELRADPRCPEELRGLLPEPLPEQTTDDTAAAAARGAAAAGGPAGGGGGGSSAAGRMRAAMAAAGSAEPGAGGPSAGAAQDGGARGFLKRLFGR
eukprot:TRINITY_DN23622_c0_g1_i1.p1 TRINITY_DN23622_c0_g1~~TRINITY_DN23622_c0_g1_i1.p1  ORF type:complete len:663 (-),score=178.04 TRINITY_DN23622_c0_g1_i1:63-2030(-)